MFSRNFLQWAPKTITASAVAMIALACAAERPLTQLPEPDSSLPQSVSGQASPANLVKRPTADTSVPYQFTPEDDGDTLLAHKQYQAAVAAYLLDPVLSARVWNKIGIAYQLLYNTTAAERCYRTAHKLEPKNATVLNNLASLQMEQKRFGPAQKLYRKALKLDPHSALFQKNLGTAYLADRQYKKGWQRYRQALATDPDIFTHSAGVLIDNPSSVTERGAMNYYMAKGCVLAGNKLQAIEYLRRALDEGFTSPKKVIADQEFAVLRDMPAFQALMADEAERR